MSVRQGQTYSPVVDRGWALVTRILAPSAQQLATPPPHVAMLKAIELSGFKSFADKTRFEFPPGVTVVVGPNGSGKSNVVDAIKWVMGTQSAKSLRGKEMTDVIFNGSGARGPQQAAEVTMTLDNQNGLLKFDSPQVHITRRVYRSGEGEYLINRQTCRLRDIRELLAGTGIATESYSIIEQGKVDALLQSSPKDRRLIFEEAAGISQFKTKRTEAARRLDRVDQNLLRLSDLVDEVENRLRSVRNQAGKARRYRDYAVRLEELRTNVGIADWQRVTRRIESLDAKSVAQQKKFSESQALAAREESLLASLESAIEDSSDALRELQAGSLASREQMVSRQSAIAEGANRSGELLHETLGYKRQISAMSVRADGATQQFRESGQLLVSARHKLAGAADTLKKKQAELEAAESRFSGTKESIQQLHASEIAATNVSSTLVSKLQVLRSQQASTIAAHEKCQAEHGQLAKSFANARDQLEECLAHKQESAQATEAAKLRLQTSQEQSVEQQRKIARTRKKLNQLERQETRISERVAVLQELERRREGYSSGVKAVLEQAQAATDGPLNDIRGVVADLLRVDVDLAPLIEIAIGEWAEYLVVTSSDRLLDWLQTDPTAIRGRVGFLQLDIRKIATALDRIDLSGEAGVLGRASGFVETDGDLEPLAQQLLGRTWLVDSLQTAVQLTGSVGRGLNFVTSDGQLLGADGRLIVGPRLASAGLITRASELRAGRDQLAELERQCKVQAKLFERQEGELDHHQAELRTTESEFAVLNKQFEALQQQSSTVQAKFEEVQQRQQHVELELKSLTDQTHVAAEEIATLDRDHDAAQQQCEKIQKQLDQWQQQLAPLESLAEELRTEVADARVVAATCEQKAEILQSQLQQLQRDQQERADAVEEVRQRLESRLLQQQTAELEILRAEQVVARLALERESLAQRVHQAIVVHNRQRNERAQRRKQLQRQQKTLGDLQNEIGRLEAATDKLQLERETLRERLRDDYGTDLSEAALKAPTAEEIENRREIEDEISDLRSKVNSIGAVNLDALEELDGLEERFQQLSGQYRDLVESKAALEKIIQRISIESRQLFVATLEVVRGHFRELFRRLFGGGEADIVLEEKEGDGQGDVLESGIEIVACPPGKEMRTISLLSGGEKTLTCVALLLAVFRSKPSPFCILDEVDAALDEANIGRFTSVLGEFLSSTQFIVITHSKKTMSGANTLYGVTMQESGISKLVSVRFDDVSEDGRILPVAKGLQKQGLQKQDGTLASLEGPAIEPRRAA